MTLELTINDFTGNIDRLAHLPSGAKLYFDGNRILIENAYRITRAAAATISGLIWGNSGRNIKDLTKIVQQMVEFPLSDFSGREIITLASQTRTAIEKLQDLKTTYLKEQKKENVDIVDQTILQMQSIHSKLCRCIDQVAREIQELEARVNQLSFENERLKMQVADLTIQLEAQKTINDAQLELLAKDPFDPQDQVSVDETPDSIEDDWDIQEQKFYEDLKRLRDTAKEDGKINRQIMEKWGILVPAPK